MYRPITWDEALIRALNGEDIKYIGEIEAADHPEWEEKRFVTGSLMNILRNLIFVEDTDDDTAMQTRVWNLQSDAVTVPYSNAVKVYSDLDQEPAPEVIPASAPEDISLKQQEPCCENAAEEEENTDKRQQEQKEESEAVPEDAASKQQEEEPALTKSNEQQEKKAKVPRKKIDDGKLTSLLNKGWTAKQIAKDMDISDSCAYEHIKKIRRTL